MKSVTYIKKKNLQNHTKAQKGYLRVLSATLARKLVDHSISQPPQIYFKWLLRKRVQFRKTLQAQLKTITIMVY